MNSNEIDPEELDIKPDISTLQPNPIESKPINEHFNIKSEIKQELNDDDLIQQIDIKNENCSDEELQNEADPLNIQSELKLEKHFTKYNEAYYECEKCGKKFSSKQGLR